MSETDAPNFFSLAFGGLFLLLMACFIVGLLLSKPNRKGPPRDPFRDC